MFKAANNVAKLINNGTEVATSISQTAASAIRILSDVPGMNPADKRDFDSASPLFALKDGTIVRTWKNSVGVDHVFLADPKGRMVFAGYVGWIHSESLKEAIKRIENELALDKPKRKRPILSPISLESARGIDYNRLLELLVDGEWKEADKETARLMLAVMKKKQWWQATPDDVAHFACKDLKTIDRLWSFYSKMRFGLLL